MGDPPTAVTELQHFRGAEYCDAPVRRLLSLLAVLVAVSLAVPASAQDDLDAVRAAVDETQRRLDDAQSRADAATADFAAAETRLGEIDVELNRLANEVDATNARLGVLRGDLAEFAVDQFTGAGGDELLVFELADLNEHARADAMAGFLAPIGRDEVDEYRSVRAEAELAERRLEELRAEQVDTLDALDEAQATVYVELATVQDELVNLNAILSALEEEERQRIEAERIAAERQRALEAAAAAAATSTTTTTTTVPVTQPVTDDDATDGDATDPDDVEPDDPPPTSTVPPPDAGDYLCPVQGPVSFTDSWGAPRSGGRKHKGVDMMAANGTPVVAPVSGTVTARDNSIGGLSFHLDGADGNYYYGTHLSSYGATGSVSAGTVIGYVGATGNATTPHLHFEVHLGGRGNAVNPYPYVAQWC